MAKCKHETSKGICEIHSSYSYCHTCDIDNLCKGYQPQTNADRIRAMSDEELAKVIICPKQVCDKLHILVCRTDCEACSLEWLKQPAEED